MIKLSAGVIYMSALMVCASGFYVSLLSKTKYCTEEEKMVWGGECQTHLDIHANKLESPFTLQSYERSSFDFCQPKDGYQHLAENFGQVLAGDRLSLLPHKIVYKKNVTDVILCKKNYVDSNDPKLHFLKNSIHQGYMHRWFMDDMPIPWCYTVANSDQLFCRKRFPIGCYVSHHGKPHDGCFISMQLSERSATYLFNHVKIMIAYYREVGENRDVVTRVLIQVASCDVYPCSRIRRGLNLFSQNLSITYSYSVEFIELEGVAWTHRWDYLLNDIPYTSSSSFLGYVAGFLTLVLSVVFFILQCSLYQNVNVTTIYSQYNNDGYSKFHWKELCGDVFRPPSHIMLLSISVGTGLHLFTTVLMVLLIACFGFLSPANHGAFLITTLISYALLGVVSGYISARLYKTMGGSYWKCNTVISTILYPGILFTIVLVLNMIHLFNHSANAIPFSTFLLLLLLWLLILVPSTLLGAVFGYRGNTIGHPIKINSIPREIPKRKCSKKLIQATAVIFFSGIFTFGYMSHFYCILYCIWEDIYYCYHFGLTFLTFIGITLICSEISIIACFRVLKKQDYHWWWCSFFNGGWSTILVMFVTIWHFFYKLTLDNTSSFLLYFGYMFLMVLLYFLLTGSLGFIACLYFIKQIYSIVKVEDPKDLICVIDETDNEQEITESTNMISPDCDEIDQSNTVNSE